MQKTMYLIRGSGKESYPAFAERIRALLEPLAQRADIKALKYTYTRQTPPRFSVIPFHRKKVASISVYQQESDLLAPLLAAAGFSGAYTVEEVFPLAYKKHWEDGAPTPGVCLLTLFRQKKGIAYDVFIDRWHNGHTPLSLKLHPLWNYSRNVVLDRHQELTEPHDGIVEEHFRTASDLLNPVKFFGPFWRMPFNMWAVYWDTVSFLDYGTIEPYLVEEVHMKSMTEGLND